MIIYLIGVGCVGKSTIGKLLSEKINYAFYDIDEEIEKYYQKSIEQLQTEALGMNSFREKGSVVLDFIFSKNENMVVAGTPSGLKYSYWKVYKKRKIEKNIISVHIKDNVKNILRRLVFYDFYSNPIEVFLDEKKKKYYQKDISEDYLFFLNSYKRADIQLYIGGICLDEIPNVILNEIEKIKNTIQLPQ